jgi:NAD(P)-dependent dehydrogenase (short-subunit alcohol dehydrogenase family)
MHDKCCVVTGGNSGIGLETAVALAELGARVAIVSRDRQKGERAVDEIRRRASSTTVELLVADLSRQRNIRALADEILAAFPRLDVLVNNAGLIVGERTVTDDGLELTFAVNHIGYFLLTQFLEERLVESAPARVVNVASDAHRSGTIAFDDLQGERGYSSWRAYAQSKLANILFTKQLAKRLAGRGVTANCLHPGVVSTNFGRSGGLFVRAFFGLASPFLTTPARGADTSVYLASSPEVAEVTGGYFVRRRLVSPSAEARDPGVAKRLWDVSEALVAGVATDRSGAADAR